MKNKNDNESSKSEYSFAKNSLQTENNSVATPFTAIASISSNPSTVAALEDSESPIVSAPVFPASPVFPAGKHPDDTGLNENQLWLHDLSFKNPPSRVVTRDPEAKPDGFYFEKWLDDTTKNINPK